MANIQLKVASEIAVEALSAAMTTAGIDSGSRGELIGQFSNEWNTRTQAMANVKVTALVDEHSLSSAPVVQAAAKAAKASKGAAATFLRRDQCSHGSEAGEDVAKYKELLVEIHKVGDILMSKPRGTYANMDGSMLWVSPLANTPGAELFIYSCGGLRPEADGNGTYPMAYFDELGVGIEVVETIGHLRKWQDNQVFGWMAPDYFLDQVASFADCCRYEEFAKDVSTGG